MGIWLLMVASTCAAGALDLKALGAKGDGKTDDTPVLKKALTEKATDIHLPAGEYTLITGFYLLDTLERLKTPAGSDFITLSTIKVE